MLTEIATLDELLHAHATELGGDFSAYRNHTYRVVNLCVALSSSDPEQLEKIAIGAAFHDMGIWTAFRRADWVDVSRGLITFGLSRRLLREIFSAWPNAGFHKRLVQLSLKRLRTHPWSPLPMMRL